MQKFQQVRRSYDNNSKVRTKSFSTQISGLTKTETSERGFQQGDVLNEIVQMSELHDDGGNDEEETFSVEEGNVGTETEWDDEVARDGGTQVVRVEVHRLTTISERTEEGEVEGDGTHDKFFSCRSNPSQ